MSKKRRNMAFMEKLTHRTSRKQ